MALINTIIGPQSYEIIRDRIAIFLQSEFNNQLELRGDYDYDVTVWLERTVRVNTSELDGGIMLVVSLATGDYSNQDVTQTLGTYVYLIDAYTKAKTTTNGGGDTRSRIRCQKALGTARGIIESTQYLTLGFAPGFVQSRKINSLQIAEPEDTGADSLTRGRLVLEVKVPEYQQVVTASLIDGSDTKMFIDISEEGFYFVNDNY